MGDSMELTQPLQYLSQSPQIEDLRLLLELISDKFQWKTWLLHTGFIFLFNRNTNLFFSSLLTLAASNNVGIYFQGDFEEQNSSVHHF